MRSPLTWFLRKPKKGVIGPVRWHRPSLERLDERITPSFLIPVPKHRDLVFDNARNLLYIPTSDGKVERFDLTSQTLLSPYTVGTSLNGADITPDGSALYVTEQQVNGSQGIVHKLSLPSGSNVDLTYPLQPFESGSLDVAIGAGNVALLTSYAGSPAKLRQIALGSGAITIRDDVPAGSLREVKNIYATPNRSTFLITTASFDLNGAFFTYTSASDSFSATQTPIPLGAYADQLAAIDRTGNRLGLGWIPVGYAIDRNGNDLATLPSVNGGLLFDPNLDVLYAANSLTDEIVAYDSVTWQEKYRLPIGENIGLTSWVDRTGAMAMSGDGRWLFLSTPSGVRALSIPIGTGTATSFEIADYSRYIKSGVASPFTVTVRDQAGNIASGYRGTVHFTSTDPAATLPADYAFTAADAGVHTFSATLATTGSHTLTATDTLTTALTGAQSGIAVHGAGALTLPIAYPHDHVFDATRNLLYITTGAGLVERFDVATETLLSPFRLGVAHGGADLTQDNNTLYIAELWPGFYNNVIHKLNLQTGTHTDVLFSLASSYEFGEYDLARAANGKIFTTGASYGPSYVHQIDTITGAVSIRLDVPRTMGGENSTVEGRTQIVRSADRSLLLFSEPQQGMGAEFLYDSTTDKFSTSVALIGYHHENDFQAVNRNGTLIAIDNDDIYDGITILNRTFAQVTRIQGRHGGLAFDPTKDVLYVADPQTKRIYAYETNSFGLLGSYDVGVSFSPTLPIQNGVMTISDDAKWLFLNVPGGVNAIPMRDRLAVSSAVSQVEAGTSATMLVQAVDWLGNLSPNYQGVVHFTSSDPFAVLPDDYTFTAGDNGAHSFSFQLKTAGAQWVTVSSVGSPSLAAGQFSFTVTPGPASAINFVQQPSNSMAGNPISPPVSGRIVDAFGNATSSNASVSIALGSNPGGVLSGTLTRAAVNGIVSFNDLSIDKAANGYTLVVSASGLTGASSNSFNISAAAPSKLSFSSQQANGTAGASLSPGFTVQVLDAFNNLTASTATITLAFGSNPGGSTLGGTASKAAVAGAATFGDLAIYKAASGYTLVATATGLTETTSNSIAIVAAAASKLAFVQQPLPSTAGAILAPAVTVQLLDPWDNPAATAAIVTIALGSNPGGSTLSGTPTVASANGVATFADLSLNKAASGYTLAASAPGLTAATSASFAITAASANKLAFGPHPANGVAGVALAPAPTVRVLDMFDNLTTSSATVTVALSANPGSATLSGTLVVNAANGLAAFGDLLLDKAALGYTLLATASGLSAATSNSFNISAGAASKLVFDQQPTSANAGAPLTPAVTVRLLDAYDNPTTSTATVTIGLGSNPGGSTLSGVLALAAVNGVATFSNVSLNKAAAGYTLIATMTGLPAITSAAFSISPAAPTKLVYLQPPTDATAGVSLAPVVTVRLLDPNDNLTTSTANVTLAFVNNPGGGALSGTLTVAAVGGVASFNDISINKAATGYTLSVASPGLTSATSGSFTITAAAPDHLTFLTQPSAAVAGASINPAVRVRILDAFDNLTNSGANVSLALGANPGSDSLGGATSVAAVGGVATFDNLSLTKAAAGYTLVAAVAGLPNVVSTTFAINPAAAFRLAFGQQPRDGTAGAALSPSVSVQSLDRYDNLATTTPVTITLAFAANPGGGALGGTTALSATNGIATFANLSIIKAAAGYALQAAATGLSGATSDTFQIQAAAADHLVFSAQPVNATAGAAFATTPAVQILDAFGNRTASTAQVALAFGSNPDGGTLEGSTTVAATNGEALFPGLFITKASAGYALSATVAGLAAINSDAFSITAAAANKLAFSQQPSSAVAGVAFSPVVKVRILDAYGNLTASTASVSLALGANPGGGTLSGTTTVSATSGVATFANVSLNKAAAGYILTASSIGLSDGSSSALTINAAAAAKIAFGQQPTTLVAGSAFTPAITVQVLDAFNNVTDSTASITISLGANPGGSVLTGNTVVAASQGVATFANLSLNKAATGYTLVAAASGFSNTTSASFAVGGGAASKLVILQQPTDAVAGNALAPAVSVRLLDANDNPAANGTQVTVALGSGPAGATLSGATQAQSSGGVATFADLSLDKAGLNYTLTLSASDITTLASSTFSITAAAAHHLAFTTPPGQGTAGSFLNPGPVVRVYDRFDNPTSAVTTIAVALASNPTGASLQGTLSRATVGGAATFADLSLNKAAAGYTLTASAAGLTSATSASFAVVPAAASKLVFAQQPATTTAGAVVGPVVVQLQDPFGNLTTSTATVALTFGANPGGGTLLGTTSRSASAGVATFGDLSLTKAASGYTLRASSTGLPTITSTSFDIQADVPAKLALSGQPGGASAGAALAPLTVSLLDQYDNLTSSTAIVAFDLGVNPGGDALTGTLSKAASAGTATFADLKLTKAASGYTLVATVSGLPQLGTNSFAITAAAPSQLLFGQGPSPAVAGAILGPALTVRILDDYGNLTNSTATVAIALGANPGGGSLTGATSRSATSGVATFADLSLAKAASGYTLVASAAGLTSTISSSFDVAAAAASQLVFGQPPSGATAGASLPSVTVRLLDPFDNLTTSSAPVTVSLTAGPAGAVLEGTTTVSAGAGVAAFSDLTLRKAGGGYILQATAAGVAGAATSPAFTIAPAAPAKLILAGQPGDGTAGAPFSVTVRILDAFDNQTTNTASIVATLAANPGGGALGGATTVSAVGGSAAFANLALTKAAAGYSLAFSSAGLAGATSNAFAIRPAAASKVVFDQPPADSVAGVVLSPSVSLRLLDPFDNLSTSTATVSLTLGASGGGAILGGTTSKPAVGGVVSFADLSLTKAAAGYTLTASAAGVASATSTSFTVAPAPAGKLTLDQQPANAVAGTTLAPLTARVLDPFDNLVPSSASFTVALSPSGPALGGTTSVAASGGVVTFNDLSLTKAATGYTLTIQGAGLAATSASFTIFPDVAAKIVLSGQPTDAVAGANLAPALAVALQDRFGNPATKDNATVITVSLTGGPAGAVLDGAKTATVQGGAASLTGLSIRRAGAGYSLAIAAAGLPGVATAPFAVAAAEPSQLAFVSQPASTPAGSAMPPVLVQVLDAFQNPVTNDNTRRVTIALGSGPEGAALQGTASADARNGVASFVDLMLQKAGAGYTLAASATRLQAAASASFAVAPLAADHLVVDVSADPPRGAPVAVHVTALDKFGNLATDFRGDIAFDGSTAVTLPTNATLVNGAAQFNVTFPLVGSATLSVAAGPLAISRDFPAPPNPPGAIAFANATLNIREGETANLVLTRTGGSGGTVTVAYDVSIASGKALKYRPDLTQDLRAATSGTVTFGSGETQKTLSLAIAGDDLVEAVEYLTVSLGQPTGGATLGPQTAMAVAIVDVNLPIVPNANPKGATLEAAGSGFGKSVEHYKDFIAKAYSRFLDRQPDAAGFSYWVNLMQLYETSKHTQGLRQEQIEAGFLDSPEYKNRYGGIGESWIRGIYHDLLGREADAGGLGYWKSALSGGTAPTEVALGFTTSLERLQNRIKETYLTLLGRSADAAGLAYWVAIFQSGGTTEDINSGFVGSPEYYAKPDGAAGNPAKWVREAYLDILFRPARVNELDYWLEFLKA